MTEGQHHFERSENIIPHLCGHKRTMLRFAQMKLRQAANDVKLRINDVALRADKLTNLHFRDKIELIERQVMK